MADETGRSGEFALIARFLAPLSQGTPEALGLQDDAAYLRPPAGLDLVLTLDTLVEGVHFLPDDPPELVAVKALRVNLSDLAAKGATARGYLLALSLADWVDDSWLAAFAKGLAADQKEFGITLFGGDTTATPGPLTLSITAFGTVPEYHMLKRSGAMPGDKVFVSGALGEAAAGLALLQGAGAVLSDNLRAGALARYRKPEPRTALAPTKRASARASRLRLSVSG